MRLASSLCGFIPVLLGCSDHDALPSEAAPFEPLARLADWSAVAPEDDPLVDEPEQIATCQASAFWLEQELGWLEIDSGACDWVTLRAPARQVVKVGQELAITVSHYDLRAAAGAEASLRLLLGECEAWSKTITIPSEAAVYEERFDSPCELEGGAPIWFHVHNHGQNTYQLQELSTRR